MKPAAQGLRRAGGRQAARHLASLGWLWLLLLIAAPARGATVTVSVDGLSGPQLLAVRENLSLVREATHPLLDQLRIERLHQRAPAEIKSALEPFGYYRPTIEPFLEEVRDGEWHALYRVQPGEPVRVASVDLQITGEGRADPRFDEWQRQFPLRPGDVLIHGQYESAKERLLQMAQDRGYFGAHLQEHRVVVDPAKGEAAITLHLDSGPRSAFGDVTFSEVPLRPSLLERYVPFAAGQPYDADQLLELQRALANSDYFERVDVVPQTEAPSQGRVPVQVTLEMRPRNRYTAGLGYGTDTGPRATLGFERRWANSLGHRVGGTAVGSEVRTSVTAYYQIPLAHPTTDLLSLAISQEQERTQTSVRTTTTFSGSASLLHDGWQQTLAGNFQQETFRVGDTVDSSRMIYPSLGLQRVVADDRLFPRSGFRVVLEGRVAREDLGSSTDLLQGVVRVKDVRPIFGGRLITRADAGSSVVSRFDKLPVSLRFFAGGDQSVRGYAYHSLGPTNGGTHLLVGSAEYDRYFGERLGAAVFFDIGNAYISTGEFSLYRGAGVGLRFRLPFGLIRVDVASALSYPDTPLRLHLSVGPEL